MPLLQEIKVPLLSVNDTSLTVNEILFKTGDKIHVGQVVIVFETSKTSYEVAAESEGFVQYACEIGEDYEVNEVVVRIFSDLSEVDHTKYAPERKNKKVSSDANIDWTGETIFSTAAQKLIEDYKLTKDQFNGFDFVGKSDVLSFLGENSRSIQSISKTSSSVLSKQTSLEVSHLKLSSGKKREIDYLSDVQLSGLTSTVHAFVDTENIFGHMNQALKALKNSLLPLVIYESARLLKKYPLLNAFYDSGNIALYKDVNPGFAIDINKGLKVLKIRNAGLLSVREIEDEILDLSVKYLDDKLELDHLSDITFTITDLSAEGTFLFKPLVNFMNSSILGISSIDTKLNRCVLSMTFDHRITEGKMAAGFLQELKIRLESYRTGNQNLDVMDVVCFRCRKRLQEDLADVGFSKCITPQGREAFICQSCFKGF